MSISPEQINLTAEQKDRLARLAEQAGKPWDEVLGEALSAYGLQARGANGGNDGSFYDAAKRLGLFGCIKGGPPDLSTNRGD